MNIFNIIEAANRKTWWKATRVATGETIVGPEEQIKAALIYDEPYTFEGIEPTHGALVVLAS